GIAGLLLQHLPHLGLRQWIRPLEPDSGQARERPFREEEPDIHLGVVALHRVRAHAVHLRRQVTAPAVVGLERGAIEAEEIGAIGGVAPGPPEGLPPRAEEAPELSGGERLVAVDLHATDLAGLLELEGGFLRAARRGPERD